MNCPNCGTPEKARVRVCTTCGTTYTSEELLEFRQLQYLLDHTKHWPNSNQMRAPYVQKFNELVQRILPASKPEPKPAPPAPVAPKPVVPTPVAPKPVMPTPVAPVAPKPAVTAPAPAKPVVPVAPPKPVAPPAPPFDWGKAWERTWSFVASGALLRGLLYLGAFMIVVSAIVLVVVYWTLFPTFVQISFILALPLSFYAGGFLLRNWLKIPVAGGVFTGIGALLVAVAFVALYRLGNLSSVVEENLYWLVASIVCLAIYVFTAMRLPSEFFGHTTIIAVSSVAMAFTQVLRLPLEWGFAAQTGTAAAIIGGAARLTRPNWDELKRAARRLPQALILAGIFFVMFGQVVSANAATFMFAGIGFGLLAWYFPKRVYAYLTVACSIAAIGYTLRAINFPPAWYAAVMAGISFAYLLAGRWTEKSRIAEIVRHAFRHALNASALGLLALAIFSGLLVLRINLWASVTALTLATIVLVECAYLFRKSLFVLGAGMLFVAPESFTCLRLLMDFQVPQSGAWLTSTWAGLGLIYLGIAVALRAASRYVKWLNVLALVFAPLTLFGLFINYSLTWRDWFALPTLAAMGVVILVYAASALVHDGGRHPALSQLIEWLPPQIHRAAFLAPLAFLLPIWMSIAWWSSVLERVWLGAALAAMAFVYVIIGQLLAMRHSEYRLPFHAFTYPIAIAGMIAALSDRSALLASSLIAVVVLVSLAVIYRRAVETALAAMLFVLPFQLALTVANILPHAHSLAYILLVAAAYLPIGIALERFGRRFAVPLYIVGYILSGYAIAVSVMPRLARWENVAWVGALVPLIASAVYVHGASRFRHVPFAWASVVVFAIAFSQTLVMLSVADAYHAASWVALAIGYMFVERILVRVSPPSPFTKGGERGIDWLQTFSLPLITGSIALAVFGWGLTIPATFNAIFNSRTADLAPYILGQLVAVAYCALVAPLYRRRLPLFIEPWLAFFPTTLFFLGFGRDIFGQSLTNVQYALVWVGLGALHIAVAAALDWTRGRYSHGLYVGGYLLSIIALVWSGSNVLTNIFTLGAFIVIAFVSHVLTHFNWHHSLDDLLAATWRARETVVRRAARAVFLFIAAYAFPFWLNQLLIYNDVSLVWRGIGLALAAPIYIAIGLGARRIKPDYTWSLYSAGYALTAIGAMITFENEYLALYVLALDAVVYAVSAYIFRRSFWLYLTTALVPMIALIALHYAQNLYAEPVARILMLIAFAYFAIGRVVQRITKSDGAIARYALPFYFPGYLLSAVAIAISSAERMTAIQIFSAGVLLYALSAWAFREMLFIYPAAWLAAVPYYLVVTLYPSAADWHGLVWLPFVVAYILLAKFVFSRAPWVARPFGAMALNPATPFYVLGYAMSVVIMAGSLANAQIATLAYVAGAGVYFGSAALFRRATWMFPGLLAAHLGFAAFLATIPSDKPPYFASVPFMVFTWLVAWVGYGFSRILPSQKGGQGGVHPALDHILTPSWSQPFFVFAALDSVLWQLIALNSPETTIPVAVGFAVLAALLAMVWQDGSLAYGTMLFALIAGLAQMEMLRIGFADRFAIVGGAGFGIYWVRRALEAIKLSVVRVWIQPLGRSAIALTALAVGVTLFSIFSNTTATAAALAFAGALYLAMAYRGRYHRLGYFAVALLQVAWILVLVTRNVRQPQFYAIPAGLYFTAVGYLERRRGNRLFALLVESLGLAVLLLTSFIQSLSFTDGFPYFLMLLIQALLVIWWGAARRIRIPFFIGLGASVLNVIAQVIVLVNVYDVNRWLVIFAVGILLTILAVFVERQRALIIAKAHEWREALEKWE